MRTIVGGDLLCVREQHCHLLPLLVPWCMLHLARERDGAVLWWLRATVTISLLPSRRHGKLLVDFLIDYDYARSWARRWPHLAASVMAVSPLPPG